MQILYELLLTVCLNGDCHFQPIKYFDDLDKCLIEKHEHEILPRDGKWKTVTYECNIHGAEGV